MAPFVKVAHRHHLPVPRRRDELGLVPGREGRLGHVRLGAVGAGHDVQLRRGRRRRRQLPHAPGLQLRAVHHLAQQHRRLAGVRPPRVLRPADVRPGVPARGAAAQDHGAGRPDEGVGDAGRRRRGPRGPDQQGPRAEHDVSLPGRRGHRRRVAGDAAGPRASAPPPASRWAARRSAPRRPPARSRPPRRPRRWRRWPARTPSRCPPAAPRCSPSPAGAAAAAIGLTVDRSRLRPPSCASRGTSRGRACPGSPGTDSSSSRLAARIASGEPKWASSARLRAGPTPGRSSSTEAVIARSRRIR